MKNNIYKMNAFIRFSFVVLLFCSILNSASAQPSFISSGQQLNNMAGRGVVLDDFNGDNKLDAFVVNEDGPEGNGYRVYFGDGSGQFTVSSQNPTNPISWAGIPVMGDIDGDSIKEVITGWTVWKNDGNGFFTADTNRFDNRSGVGIMQMGLSYLNNDSFPDIFCTVYGGSGTSTRVYLNNGTGQFHDAGFSFGQGLPYTFALGDINGDTIVDVVTSGWKNESGDPCPNRIGINDGSGKFTETGQLIELAMAHSHGIALGDLDKDGDLDLVIVAQQSPYCQIYFNDGKGLFALGPKIGSKAVENVCLGDLDGDGDLDIFLACLTSNQVWLNTGAGQFENSNLKLGASVWSWCAALGDINNDGRLDAFVANIAFDDPYVPRGRVAEVWLNTTFICDYFGQTPPGDTAVMFAKDLVTFQGSFESSLTITPDGKEIYFVSYSGNEGGIYYSKYTNNTWTEITKLPVALTGNITNTFISANGRKLFFTLWTTDYSTSDIYLMERTTTGWSEPKILPAPFNSVSRDEAYSESAEGIGYFTSNRSGGQGAIDIWKISSTNGSYNAENLGSVLNSSSYDFASRIAPDGSYLVYNSFRSANYSLQDLWITFKKNNNEWTIPVGLQKSRAIINLKNYNQHSPSFSPDGKYMFFCRENNTNDQCDLYWLSTSFIPSLKKEVFAPKLNKQIPTMNITTDSTINYVIPENTFCCEYGTSTLKYTATLKNGAALPDWLHFDPKTRTLSGKPTQAETDTLQITATNADDMSSTCTFKIKIIENVSIGQLDDKKIELFPNPANGEINILFGNTKKKAVVEICNIGGQKIFSKTYLNSASATVDLTGYPKGMYLVNIIAEGNNITEKLILN